jgi:hypothetical protein
MTGRKKAQSQYGENKRFSNLQFKKNLVVVEQTVRTAVPNSNEKC